MEHGEKEMPQMPKMSQMFQNKITLRMGCSD